MKKALSMVLLVTLIFSAMTSPVLAAVDTTTTATPAATTAPVAPVKTTTPVKTTAPVAATTAIDVNKLPAGYVYTVVSGDAFWKIGKKFNLTISQLAKLNPQIKNISLIYPGQKIIVKAAPAVATAPATTPVAARKLYHGFGEATNYRNSHVSLNITTASVIFDQDGKIVNLTWDVQEITPETFPAWQTTPEEGKALTAAIDDKWLTKQEEKFEYGMTSRIVAMSFCEPRSWTRVLSS